MNKRQTVVLWVGIIAFLLMGLFPPWYWKHGTGRYNYKYGLIFTQSPTYARVDYYRLTLQEVMLIALSAFLIFAFRNPVSDFERNLQKLCKALFKVVVILAIIILVAWGTAEVIPLIPWFNKLGL